MGVCASCMCARVSLLDFVRQDSGTLRYHSFWHGHIHYNVHFHYNKPDREKKDTEVNKRSGSVHQL